MVCRRACEAFGSVDRIMFGGRPPWPVEHAQGAAVLAPGPAQLARCGGARFGLGDLQPQPAPLQRDHVPCACASGAGATGRAPTRR
jgi:hypothetical protein